MTLNFSECTQPNHALDFAFSDNNQDRDELILEYLHLVSAIAAHVQRSLPVHVELDDLIHAGTMGLVDAAAKFQSGKQVAFPAYAKHRIRGAILDSLRQMDWASRDLRKRYKQMETLKRDLTARLNREPSDAELAQAMGLDARRWQALMVDFRSLAAAAVQQRSDREDQAPMEVPSSPAFCPSQTLIRSELRNKLQAAMETLPERYQKVVQMYYDGDLTMKEIGDTLGVNESRVSQIHKSALARMQAALQSTGVHSAAAFC